MHQTASFFEQPPDKFTNALILLGRSSGHSSDSSMPQVDSRTHFVKILCGSLFRCMQATATTHLQKFSMGHSSDAFGPPLQTRLQTFFVGHSSGVDASLGAMCGPVRGGFSPGHSSDQGRPSNHGPQVNPPGLFSGQRARVRNLPVPLPACLPVQP
jgi:hypothetical protein